MKPIKISDLAARLGGTFHNATGEEWVYGFAWDSRMDMSGYLFLAIRGNRVDGHDFADEVLFREHRGTGPAIASLVERPIKGSHILVSNLVDALARMASSFRDEFNGPVVGITGSAGKTTTKELTAAALSPLGEILKSHGNHNTEYTSPLTWAELTPTTSAAVVELAMRGFGQIRHLAAFARPTVGLITNIGFAHIEQVKTRAGIAEAKGELLQSLPDDGPAILWQDDPFLDVLRGKVKSGRVLTFGFSESCDSSIRSFQPISWEHSVLRGSIHGVSYEIEVPFAGRHLALNTAAALLVAHTVGVSVADASEAIGRVELPPMRMQTREFKGAKVLMDNYNASPPSMVAAIETFFEVPTTGRRFAILGEMKELGTSTEEGHRMVGRALAAESIDRVAFIGDPMEFARKEAVALGMSPEKFLMAGNLDDLREFLADLRPEDVVLVKGSRALELERVFE